MRRKWPERYSIYIPQQSRVRRSYIIGGSISNNSTDKHNTYYYADANNIISQIKQFRSDGAEDSQIIKDKVHAKLPERENYQKLKNRILQPGDTLTVCSLSVLGSKYAARAELMYYREHHIRIRVLNMPATMQEFSENQEFLYDIITDTIAQTLTTVITQERQRIKRQQWRGIETLKESAAWEDYGRPSVTIPDNYIEVMDRWVSGKITAAAAMNLTGLKRTTFYKLANQYRKGELQI